MPMRYIFNESTQMFEMERPKSFNRNTITNNHIENMFKKTPKKKTLIDKIVNFFVRCK